MVILFLTTVLLSITLVQGLPGCWAGPSPRGRVCIEKNILNGQLSLDVRYTITSRFTRVCCEALACTDFRGCRLMDIGCGQGTMTSQSLPWELRDINPLVKCYTTDQTNPGFYGFETKVA